MAYDSTFSHLDVGKKAMQLIILGMDRSDTSVLARLSNMMGASLDEPAANWEMFHLAFLNFLIGYRINQSNTKRKGAVIFQERVFCKDSILST